MSNGASIVWRSIVKAINALKDGFSFKIGEGGTSMWCVDWLGLGKICNLVDFVHIADTDKRIKDVCLDGTWHLNQLYTTLPPNISESILHKQVTASLTNNLPDCWVWLAAKDGCYSVASAYRWLLERKVA